MKKNILFLTNKKLSKKLEQLKQDYEIVTAANALKAYNSVILSPPDAIVYIPSEYIFSGYHLAKLLEMFDETSKIPFIIINDRYVFPHRPDIKNIIELNPNSDYETIKNIVDCAVKNAKIQKTDILKLKPAPKQIKKMTSNIIDEILISSSVVNEFKQLINCMNFEDTLTANIFKIVKKYIPYDIAGLFFNKSDEKARNILNLSLPKKNINIKTVNKSRDKFFDEVEKYKTVNEIQCSLTDGDICENGGIKHSSLKQSAAIMYKYDEKLSGGFFIGGKKEPDMYQKAFLSIILKELDVIFKLKYLFNEQSDNALTDVMTGLFNRQEFDANLEKEFHRARRYIYNFTLAMIDIDRLSKINEDYGREFGDFVIKELSTLLKGVFRRTDLIYRYGSEEIIVLLPSTPITKSVIPIERLRSKIAGHTFEKGGIKTNITVSIGLCANYSRFSEPEQLVSAVETSLLQAKEKGRNRIDIFE
ncbi:MAG: GGDEF domain-containing protein [Candidatus Gastranaerophilales bacterium]|nr:GGDEF domain-containing protein [Candidatus Gastranaerophilales bacterium]